MDVLYVNNDHVVEIQGLRDAAGKLISDATAEATLYEADGITEVTGVTWPLALTPTSRAGVYQGNLTASVGVENRKRYELKLSAVSVGKRLEVTRTVKVETRYS